VLVTCLLRIGICFAHLPEQGRPCETLTEISCSPVRETAPNSSQDKTTTMNCDDVTIDYNCVHFNLEVATLRASSSKRGFNLLNIVKVNFSQCLTK
jgi:hypothetical protein